MSAEQQRRVDRMATAELLQLAAEAAISVDYEDQRRWALVRELHERPGPEVFEKACRWCEDADHRRRVLAADLLGQLGFREKKRPFLLESQSRLAAMIDDDEPDVVAAAVTALSHFPQNLHLRRVISVADHAETDVRGAVASCLGSESSDEAIAALVALSRDEDEEVRNWATFGLASQCSVDTEAVRQALVDRLDEEDIEVRGEALVGLARRGDPRVIEPLAAELRLDTVGVLVVEAASLMPSPRFVTALEALAKVEPDDALLIEALQRCRKAR